MFSTVWEGWDQYPWWLRAWDVWGRLGGLLDRFGVCFGRLEVSCDRRRVGSLVSYRRAALVAS